jgi:hypothetical protein
MFLLKAEVRVARDALRVFRKSIASLDVLVADNRVLAPLTDWSAVITEKVNAFALAIDTGHCPSFRPWYSGSFAERIRTEPRLTKNLALDVLSHFFPIRDQTNKVITVLSARLPATLHLLTLFGGIVADFVSVESALYGRFPELEPAEVSGR